MCVIKNIKTQTMMKMKTIVRKFLGYFIFVDSLVIAFSFFMQGGWLLNTQIAFFCSLLITLATFVSYQKLVERRVEAGAYGEEKDVLKKYEDPHDLYDDEEEQEAQSEAEVKEHKKIGFRESFRNLTQSYKGALSPYRLGAYGVLFLTILALIRHEALEPIAFFVGLSIVPLSSLFLGNKGLK